MSSRIGTLLAAACLTAAATGATSASAQERVVRIAHVGPTSGPSAHLGKDNENGVRMAVDDLNAKGLKIGAQRLRFELVAEDDAGDPKQGSAVAQRLCDLRVNGVVGHMNSGPNGPASRIYEECGLPHITPSATDPALSRSGHKTFFRLLANDDALGAGLALHAVNNLKLRRLAVIDDRTAYGQGVAEVFKKNAIASGATIVAEQYTSDKAVDFSAALTAIKAQSPDGIFFGGMDSQAGPMLRQMEQLGLGNVRFLGGDGLCTDALMSLSGGARTIANVVCAEGGASLARMPGGRAWKVRYDARFPKQFQVYSPYAYDAAMVLAEAMLLAGSTDPKVYAAQLFNVQYQGVTAKIAFEPDGELKSPSMTLYIYKDGRKLPLN